MAGPRDFSGEISLAAGVPAAALQSLVNLAVAAWAQVAARPALGASVKLELVDPVMPSLSCTLGHLSLVHVTCASRPLMYYVCVCVLRFCHSQLAQLPLKP